MKPSVGHHNILHKNCFTTAEKRNVIKRKFTEKSFKIRKILKNISSLVNEIFHAQFVKISKYLLPPIKIIFAFLLKQWHFFGANKSIPNWLIASIKIYDLFFLQCIPVLQTLYSNFTTHCSNFISLHMISTAIRIKKPKYEKHIHWSSDDVMTNGCDD